MSDFTEHHATVAAALEACCVSGTAGSAAVLAAGVDAVAAANAGETKGIIGLPEGIESDFSKNRAVVPGAAEKHATAGESEEILGLHVSPSSLHNSSNSRGCVAAVACARLPAVPGVSQVHAFAPFLHLLLCLLLLHMRRFTPMHDAHNSGGTGGLLPVQRSTSYCLGNSWSDTGRVTGPTGRRCTKGGVSGPGRRFASCLRGGGRGKFSAGRRCTGAGCRFTSQEATRHFRNQAGSRGSVWLHTFPPPGGFWYPIRVTWTRIGHQTINGLDEGV